MTTFCRVGCLGVVSALLLAAIVPAQGPAGDKGRMDVEVVKYAGLGDFVLKNRGKVILVDFWDSG